MTEIRVSPSVSAIETGLRRVTASELLLAVERFGVPLDYFTDPFRLDGEGLFSWRQTGVDPDRLSEYERTAARPRLHFEIPNARPRPAQQVQTAARGPIQDFESQLHTSFARTEWTVTKEARAGHD